MTATIFFPFTYIDITTNLINTNTGVTGTNNSFTVNLTNLNLDSRYRWYFQLQQVVYQNVDLTPAVVFPIITCDQIQPIYENNVRSNILYKGRYQANSTDVITDSINTNTSLYIETNVSGTLNVLKIEFFRSDNGDEFPISDGGYVTMLLALYRVKP